MSRSILQLLPYLVCDDFVSLGLLRSAEFTVPGKEQFNKSKHLLLGDVGFKKLPDGTDYVVVTMKSSKTDRQNRGFSVIIGCNEHEDCAYCAMQIYIAKHSILAGSDRPLYMYENGTPLTKALLVKHTKLYLSLVGYNPEEYCGHSYRIGGATTAAAAAGLSDWQIKLLGRWKSNAYQRYIRAPVELLVGISNKITNRFYKTTLFHSRNAYISNCI